MNLHVPQSLEAENEMARLSHLATQIVSPKNAIPCMGLVQDGLLGLYLFNRHGFLTVKNAMKMANDLGLKIPLNFSTTRDDGTLTISSRDILNATLPKITVVNAKGPIGSDQVQYGRIKPGGMIETSTLKAGKSGLFHIAWNDYGPEVSRRLFDNLARIATNWLLVSGFSVGILDCIPNTYIKNRIVGVIHVYEEATQYLVNYQQLRSLPKLQTELVNGDDASTYLAALNRLLNTVKDEGYTYNNKALIESLLGQIYYDFLVNRLLFEFYRLDRFQESFPGKHLETLFNENADLVMTLYLKPKDKDKQDDPIKRFEEQVKLSDLDPAIQTKFTKLREIMAPFQASKGYFGSRAEIQRTLQSQTGVNLLGEGEPNDALINQIEALGAFIGTLLYIVPGSKDMSERLEEKLYQLTQGSTVIVNTVISINTGFYEYQGLDKDYFKYMGNSFKTMISAGSKGETKNLGQIAGLLGQQDLEGKRQGNFFYRRSLPHYPKDSIEPKFRGYVQNSFLDGLNVLEYFSHAQAGRLNQIDKSIKSVTPDTDIIVMEDGKVKQLTIGEWIDTKLDCNASEVIHQTEQEMEILKLKNSAFIPTCDEDGKVSWGQITAITRHDPGKQLYRVKTLGGRSVIVTESKSLLIYKPQLKKFLHTSTPEVVVGDFMPVTKNLPAIPNINAIEALIINNESFLNNYENGFKYGKLFGYENSSELPEDIFIMNSEFIKGFINACFTNGFYNSMNEKLIDGMILLTNLLGYSIQKSIIVDYYNKVYFQCNITQFGEVQNDVVLDKITEITLVDVIEYPKVYDLTVPSTLNFGLANGLHVVDTAETGYLQRRLIKMLEALTNGYDGAIRNSSRNVIQKLYGGDAINPQHLEKVKLEIGNIEKRFRFTPGDLKTLESILQPDIAATVKDSYDYLNLANVQERHIRSLTESLAELYVGTGLELSETLKQEGKSQTVVTYLPVNFERLIHNNYFRYNLTEVTKTDLDPEFIFEAIEALYKRIEAGLVLNAYEHCLMFNLALHSYLNSKTLLLTYKFTREAFQTLLEDIYLKYARSIMAPGESIGIISAQSIGEPLTQMTLNKFHAAGVGKARSKLQGGVPRLSELLGLTKKEKMKTPSMSLEVSDYYLYTQEAIGSQMNIDMNLVNLLKSFKFYNLVSTSEICYDPAQTRPNLPAPYAVNDNQKTPLGVAAPVQGFPWLIHFEMKPAVKRELRSDALMTSLDNHIRSKFKNSDGKFLVQVSYDGLLEEGKLASFVNIRVKSTLFEGEGDNILSNLVDLKNELLRLNIKGYKEISEVFVEREDGKKIVFTLGSSLASIIENPVYSSVIDINKITTNDVLEVEHLYGIEAARNSFINEMYTTFDSDINIRHLELLADNMSHLGELLRVNRFGVKRGNNEPLHRASFEETTKQFVDSSIHTEKDPMTGPSANIMFGQFIHSGTNCFKIMLDTEKLLTLEPVERQTDLITVDPFNVEGVEKIKIPNTTQLSIDFLKIEDLFIFKFNRL